MARNITVIPAKTRNHNVNSQVAANAKIRVAAYCRVSTDREEQESSFKNQQDYYTKYIADHADYTMAGIYADEGITATNTKKRENFKRMIEDCEKGNIDLVITKSISRFARNTQDCLFYSRKLKELRIPIIFEKEGINTMDASGELLFTILSSLAQEESRNISENCKWAIRHNFAKGKPSLDAKHFLGYDKNEDGKLVVNKEQAALVKRIFLLFEEGLSETEIGHVLRGEGIKGMRGDTWPNTAIRNMLRNEKYCGDLLMQKTYTVDFLSKKKAKNNGEVEQYFVEDNHEAIIPKDEWKAVQLELDRRECYMQEFGLGIYSNCFSPYSGHIICPKCGRPFRKCGGKNNSLDYWMCASKKDNGAGACSAENIKAKSLDEAFRIAWNSLVKDRNKLKKEWERRINEGDPLERLRAKQFIAQTEEGAIKAVYQELIRLVLERINVIDKTTFEVRFLDGSVKMVCLPTE